MGNGNWKTRNTVSKPLKSAFCLHYISIMINNNLIILFCRLLLLNKLLEDGNILYRKNRLQEAAHRYQYALRKIPSAATFGEYTDTFLQLKVNFLLNHSRCKRKMNVSIFVSLTCIKLTNKAN